MHNWMRKEFKDDLLFLWDESAWLFQNSTGKANWDKYAEQIQNHGALGTLYPKFKYGVEGDTPSYLYVWPNGLNDPEHPTYGGWGGIFERETGPDKETTAYVNQQGTTAGSIARTYETRFYPAIFNSFAARMVWAKDGKGNRNPEVVVNGDRIIDRRSPAAHAAKRICLRDTSSSCRETSERSLCIIWNGRDHCQGRPRSLKYLVLLILGNLQRGMHNEPSAQTSSHLRSACDMSHGAGVHHIFRHLQHHGRSGTNAFPSDPVAAQRRMAFCQG